MTQDDLDPAREPVFIDLETRSACDLPRAGGWNYANHPTTHLLTVAWSPAEGEYHIWFPWHDRIPQDYLDAQQIKARIHTGIELPDALLSVMDRPWCAHNAWNFDALVWRKLFGDMHQPADWIDTEPLARTVGLPGGLDAIGKKLLGEGKYAAAKSTLKKYTRDSRAYGDAADVPAGVMPMLAEYNIRDVRLLRSVWAEIIAWLKMPQAEWDVLNVHREINDHGAPIDQDLLIALIDLTEEGRVEAVKRIAELTRGGKVELLTINDLQSRVKMFSWLDSIGITAFGNAKKGSLRKELIAQFIDIHQQGDEDGSEEEGGSGELDEDIDPSDPEEARELARTTFLAVRVLQLRSAALRITGGKLAAAATAVCDDGRVRGLFVYAGAHTWRWAGRRIQVQNLPRPKDGIDFWGIIDAFDNSRFMCQSRCLPYATVDALLPDRTNPRFRSLTPDDAAAALLRGIFTPDAAEAVGSSSVPIPPSDPIGVLAADLSNIEARVLAEFAGEQWLIDAFWKGFDPYIPMAEAVFGPREKWPGYDPKKVKKHQYRQVGKIIELGSGYQLGGKQMNIYAAASGIDLAANDTDGPTCVKAYRNTHSAIAGTPREVEIWDKKTKKMKVITVYDGGFWKNLENAAKMAVKYPGEAYTVGAGLKATFMTEGPHLMCYLPSGRRLVYRDVRIDPHHVPPYLVGEYDKDGRQKTTEALVYVSPRYGRVHMYGGKWAENVVQATSRDYLANGLVNCRREISIPVIHVHDEGVNLGRYSQKAAFMSAFTRLPTWSPNFPLDAEGGWMPRYSKSPPPGPLYKEEVWRNGSYLKPA